MIQINEHYSKLKSSYLFSEIARRVGAVRATGKNIISLGIGDVTRALSPTVTAAFLKGVEEMGNDATFRGYGPEQGYLFLREAIAHGDFAARGIDISPDEVFVSDGAKCDSANIQELFADKTAIAVPDPVYPVYVDSNVMAGRTGEWADGRYQGLYYLASTAKNGFVPTPADVAAIESSPHGDRSNPISLVYLCFPNNPTGAVITHQKLREWVDWAIEAKALLLYDAAYVEFIRDDTIPHSIFETEGARKVAIEFRSFSKTAGFTGTRCAYTVVPHECRAWNEAGGEVPLHPMWLRRCTTKSNGVAYPVQRAAEAVYSPEGQQEMRAGIDYWLDNAARIRRTIEQIGFKYTGGYHSPYIWVDIEGADSWELFDRILHEAAVVTTPGAGFGRCGEGYLRISAFNNRDSVEEAMERIQKVLEPSHRNGSSRDSEGTKTEN